MKPHTRVRPRSIASPELLEARIAPATFRWDVPGSGIWNDENNWFNETTGLADNGFPKSANDVAKFTDANAGNAVVTINGVNVTVGSILFDDDNIYQIADAGGGTLTFGASEMGAITVSNSNGDAPHTISAPIILASSLRITHEAMSDFTISASISEPSPGREVSKTGPGKVFFSNPVGVPLPNTYTGTTTVEEGALVFLKSPGVPATSGNLIVGGFGRVASVAVLGNSQIPDTLAVNVGALGTMSINISETIGALTINGGTVDLGPINSTGLTVSSLNMTGGKVQMSFLSQFLFLNGDVTATSTANGPAEINGGTLNLGQATRTFVVNDGPHEQDFVVNGITTGSGPSALTKTNLGTMRMAGPGFNTYSGSTTVIAGVLELAKPGGNSISGPLVIGNGAGGSDVVRLLHPNQIGNNVINVNSGGLLDLNGQAETLGSVSISGGHVTTGAGATTLTIANGLSLTGGHLTAAAAGSQIVVPAVVTINNGGQSLLDGLGTLGLVANTTFNVNNGSASVDLLVTIPITGAFTLSKTGTGTLQLDAINTYAETLAFGELIVNGKIGNLFFGSSQTTLSGTGNVGIVTLNNGAVRPGNGPGVLHVASIIMGGTPTMFFEIDGAKPGNGPGFHDQIALTGGVNLNGVIANFSITADFAQGDQYMLIDNDSTDPVVGTFTGMPEGFVTTIGTRRYILTYKGGTGNDVVLTPEQSFIIEGDYVPGADEYFVIQRDVTDSHLIHVTAFAAGSSSKTYDISLAQFANIVIRGGAGDDSILLDISKGFFTSLFPSVFYALSFVGGAGNNAVSISSGPAVPLASASYVHTGDPDRGGLFLSNGFRMSFDEVNYFTDELNVTDYFVVGGAGVSDAMYLAPGFGAYTAVGKEGQLPAHVRNKSNIIFSGQGGGDRFDIGVVNPFSDTDEITIDPGTGQTGQLNLFGTGGADVFTLTTTSPIEGTIVRNGQPALTYEGALKIAIDGSAGADTFNLPGEDFDIHVTGGPGIDTLSFVESASGVTLNLDQPGISQALTASANLTLADSMEEVTGSTHADTFLAKITPYPRSLAGGQGNDILLFDVLGTNATNTGGVILTPGFGTFTTSNVESITLLNIPAKPVFGVQGNTFAAPLDIPTGKGPLSVAVGDLNGDGIDDFVTADSKANTLSVFLSTPSGLFLPAVQKLTGGKKPTGVIIADLDGINGPDIAVTNSATGNVGVLLNSGAGDFANAVTFTTGKTPGVLRAGNLDGDGDIDLAMITAGNKLTILKGNGDGTFAAGSAIPTGAVLPKDIQLADFDGDNDIDLAVLHAGGQLAVQLNDGSATFTPQALTRTGVGATSLAIADFNGDGKLDAAVSHATVSRFVAVMLGQGDGAFLPMLRIAYPLPGKASALVASDFDGDGTTDLAVANGAGGRISILRGLGNGTFAKSLALELEDTPARKLAALTLGDFNGNSRADLLALGSAAGEVSLLLRA